MSQARQVAAAGAQQQKAHPAAREAAQIGVPLLAPISLELYAELFKALCKGDAGGRVAAINHMESAWFKIKDVQAVLALHGLGDGGHRKKHELLEAMHGLRLYPPVPDCASLATPPDQPPAPASATPPPPPAAGASQHPAPGGRAAAPKQQGQPRITTFFTPPPSASAPSPWGLVGLRAEDLGVLGWGWGHSPALQEHAKQAMQQAPLVMKRPQRAADQAPAPPPSASLAAVARAPTAEPASAVVATPPPVGPAPERALQPATSPLPPPPQPSESAAAGAQGAALARANAPAPAPGAQQQQQQQQAAGAPQQLEEGGRMAWLAMALVTFAQDAPGVVGSDEPLPGGPGQLVGRRVGFLLLSPIQHTNSRGQPEGTIAAGLHQGAVQRRVGTSCRYELCEPGCAGGHEWCAVRLLGDVQPHHQSQARVELTLDLSARHRLPDLPALLTLAHHEDRLQDAWVLLKARGGGGFGGGDGGAEEDEGGGGGGTLRGARPTGSTASGVGVGRGGGRRGGGAVGRGAASRS